MGHVIRAERGSDIFELTAFYIKGIAVGVVGVRETVFWVRFTPF